MIERRRVVGGNGGKDYSKEYLTFISTGRYFSFTRSVNDTYYSTDNGSTWTLLSASTASPSFSNGTVVILKSTSDPNSGWGVGTFSFSGDTVDIKGNPLSLISGDSFTRCVEIPDNAFMNLFMGASGIRDIYNLSFPDLPLGSRCYKSMFEGCTYLDSVPEILNSTQLAYSCYESMFRGCRLLNCATPALPATILAQDCYYNMFYGCTGLKYCHGLGGTTGITSAGKNSCSSMFYNCSSLEMAPNLTATTLGDNCYFHMFHGCTSLTTAPNIYITSTSVGCCNNMFYGCTGLANVSNIHLNATTLSNSCYYGMFSGCTSLTTAPDLPALNLANGCYQYMFDGCTSLNYIKCMCLTKPSTTYLYYWVNNVPSGGTFVKNSAATWTNSFGVSAIPSGWTVTTASS